MTFCRRDNSPGKRILNALKPTKGTLWKIIEEGITVIQFGRNKSISKQNGRVMIKRGSNLT